MTFLIFLWYNTVWLICCSEAGWRWGRRRRRRRIGLHAEQTGASNQFNKAIVKKATRTEQANELKNEQGMEGLESELTNRQGEELKGKMDTGQANPLDATEVKDELNAEELNELDLTEQEADELKADLQDSKHDYDNAEEEWKMPTQAEPGNLDYFATDTSSLAYILLLLLLKINKTIIQSRTSFLPSAIVVINNCPLIPSPL